MPRMEDEMRDSTFTIDQLGELRLIEKARIKKGEPGLRTELQALIARLKANDPRESQARPLYNRGFGGKSSFVKYLASVPEIPEVLKAGNDRFPELALVDARLPISRICELLAVEFPNGDGFYVDFDPKTAKTDKVYWIRAQDGRKNNGKSVWTCRESFAEDEVGLSVYEGLALFVQYPMPFRGRAMDLGGSVLRKDRSRGACLHWFYTRPLLSPFSEGHVGPYHGSASRLK